MSEPLSPLVELESIDTHLCIIRLAYPDQDFDANLHRALHNLKAPCLPIPEAWDMFKVSENHMLHMFQASYDNNLDSAESERKAALAALRSLKKILVNHNIS